MKLESYDKLVQAIAASLARQNAPLPVTPEAKAELRKRLFRVLRIREEWLPSISWKCVGKADFGEVDTETLFFRSWQGMYGYATLYMPRKREGRIPAMLFSPGHAMDTGRFQCNYQIMAQLLAAKGTAVLLFDQFGLGQRAHTGHSSAYATFACGTTVSGLMVLEDMALFNALASDERFDAGRIGIMGHSGGGQNTLFLSMALYDKAALAVASGWACSFEYTARKERKLCACDLFPGILHEFEVWHSIGCLYPKPIMCCSGAGDSMIARDVVLQLKHRLEAFYAPGKSEVFIWNGGHKWETPQDFAHVADFVLGNFGLPCYGETLSEKPDTFFPSGPVTEMPAYPDDAIDISELASRLTGVRPGKANAQSDVFPIPDFLSKEEYEALDDEAKVYFMQAGVFL